MTYELPVVLNPHGRMPGIILVDHAGSGIPKFIGNPDHCHEWRDTHHFCDLGTDALARLLADRLDVPVVMGTTSRLVIDLNRWVEDPRSITQQIDGHPIASNTNLSDAARRQRHDRIFWPYHQAIGHHWAKVVDRHPDPGLFALHSCTRTFLGQRRQWDGGTIWHDDARFSRQLLAALGETDSLVLGDNQPYSGKDGIFTVDHHTFGSGVRACGFEVSNDMLETPFGVSRWAELLSNALEKVMKMVRSDGLQY